MSKSSGKSGWKWIEGLVLLLLILATILMGERMHQDSLTRVTASTPGNGMPENPEHSVKNGGNWVKRAQAVHIKPAFEWTADSARPGRNTPPFP